MCLDFLTRLYIPWNDISHLSWGLASCLTTSIGGQFNVDITRRHSFLHFWNILEARTFTSFLCLKPKANLLTMLLLRLDFHRSSKHFFCSCHLDMLPAFPAKPRNPMWTMHLWELWLIATGGMAIEQRVCPLFASKATWIAEQEPFWLKWKPPCVRWNRGS